MPPTLRNKDASISCLPRKQLEELIPRYGSVLVLVRSPDHLLQVLLSEVFRKLVGDPAQVSDCDEAGPFGVEEAEDVVDVFARVLLDESGGEQVDELFEGDVACTFGIEVDDELVDGPVAYICSQGGHGGLELQVERGVPLGLMEPTCSLSKRSKVSLISRMSVSLRPGRWQGRVSNLGLMGCCCGCLAVLLIYAINLLKNDKIQSQLYSQRSSLCLRITAIQIMAALVDDNQMEANPNPQPEQEVTILVPSKKIQINSIDHELAQPLLAAQPHYASVSSIRIEGNSYSLEFCQVLGDILAKTKNIKDLNINDIFVSRLKEEIPKSIEYISKGLVGSSLLRLDISCNAVNPYGAEALQIYLKQATSLQVLLIYNCGLGPYGVPKIAEGLKGTPSLRTFSIARNRMGNPGILSIAAVLQYLPLLEELFVYENSANEEGLTELFKNLRTHCKQLRSLDVGDNLIKTTATAELVLLIKQNLNLRNLNLSDNLSKKESASVVQALKESVNRNWEKLGLNYAELTSKQTRELIATLKECPLKRLDIVGNEFEEDVQEQLTSAFAEGVLSKFEDEDEEEVIKLMEELKI